MRSAFTLVLLACYMAVAAPALSVVERAWHEGTLLSSERQERKSTLKDSDTDYSTDHSGNGHESTSTRTTDMTTAVFLIFTISDGERTYEARQGTTVWQTKMKAVPGDKVQFAVDGDSLYIRRDDGKESKMKILKVSVNSQNGPTQR